jgi:8-oxo-dGTP pyrophosphatase MutT (NUDIX family)
MTSRATSEAIPAATLIVVRERAGGPPELLMVERSEGMAFAAGAFVFPGGRIDEADRGLADETEWPDGAARVAAIRETLEETAIPIGITPEPGFVQADRLQGALAEDHPFATLLLEGERKLDLEALTPFARWVPKFHAVRRFDTMFYVVEAPLGPWEPRVMEGECAGAYWLTAREVLDREERGEARLIFPTRRNLERLAQHSSFEEIRADALAHPIEPVTPWVEEHGGEKFITIPDHLGYPVTREKLDGLWRG